MTLLFFDPFSGASGDMILGALIDAGAEEDVVRASLEALDVPGWSLEVSSVIRGPVRATRAEVTVSDTPQERTYRGVVDLLQAAPLPPGVHKRALETFGLLADAEATVHGQDRDQVHFHEVGGLDAVVDVVGCAAALEHFRPTLVVSGPIATGAGLTETAHGPLPLPAPAVTELLKGAVLVGRGDQELITPTGAAVLAAASDSFGDLPPMRLEATGYGAGARELPTPNALRVLVGEEVAGGARETAPGTRAVVLEANLDDMSPELLPPVMEALLEAGAHDAWVTPTLMKKGRPAYTLSVLTTPTEMGAMAKLVFRETTTLGLREIPVTKRALERQWITVEVAGWPVRVKLGFERDEVLTVSPEYEDAAEAAHSSGLPLKDVYVSAAENARRLTRRGNRPG